MVENHRGRYTDAGIAPAVASAAGDEMENGETKARVSGAESSRKLLQLLFLFSRERPLWTVAEIGEELSLTQSMVYRYLALLREVGLVDPAGGKAYRVTDLARNLAEAAAAARAPLEELARPALARVRDAVNETAYVTRRSGWIAYIAELAETSHPIRLIFERGQALPLSLGPNARLHLAAMSRAERATYFRSFGVDRARFNPHLLSDDALDEVQAAGVAESTEEVGEGIWAVAAAIRSESRTVATFSVGAPLYRVDPALRRTIRDLVVGAADEIATVASVPLQTTYQPVK